MAKIMKAWVEWQIWRDERGQDFVEYALMAGFVALIAGAVIPVVITPHLSGIWSKVNNVLMRWV